MDDLIELDIKKAIIKKLPLFAQLTSEELEELARLWVDVKFAAGETIVSEGEPVDKVFLIIKGEADVRKLAIKDQALVLESVAKLGPNDAIGLNETGFYSISGKRTATIVAITDMHLLGLNIAEFHGFSLAHSHVSEIMRKNSEAYLGDVKLE